jgi:hypothetical protein
MRESTVINEWIADGRAEGRRADLVRALRVRFRAEVPEDLLAAIEALSDGDELTRWFDAALTTGSMEDFRAAIHQ